VSRKLNILHYIETSGPGGAETVLLNIAKGIDKSRFNSTAVLHESDWLHEQLLSNGVETEIIPSRHSWDIFFLMKFIGYCRRHKIDLIHSHLFGANLYSCLAGAVLRLPVVATFHNELFFRGRLEKFMTIKSALIRKFASRMVFVAEFMKKDYLNYMRLSGDRMLTVYNGIDLKEYNGETDKSALKKELGIEEGDPIVGHVANFRAPKGHNYLIEAASRVCQSIPGARFLLIGHPGDGTIKKEIEGKIAGLGLEENVQILGFRKDVSRMLRLMDIFVLSSTSEGLPLSVIEAMASSKPVVVTNVGGLPEIVVPDRTGYLVEAKDAGALAEKIIILLEDEALRKQMGEAGRKLVEEKYSLRAMIDSYQKLYEDLAG